MAATGTDSALGQQPDDLRQGGDRQVRDASPRYTAALRTVDAG